MSKNCLIVCISFFNLIILTMLHAGTQNMDNTAHLLHKSLGAVIDSTENDKYNRFDTNSGRRRRIFASRNSERRG